MVRLHLRLKDVFLLGVLFLFVFFSTSQASEDAILGENIRTAQNLVQTDTANIVPHENESVKATDTDQQEIPNLPGPKVISIEIEGNKEVVTQHILSAITTKIDEPVDEEKLRKDAESIFELGFFAAADYKVKDQDGGVEVVFVVQENPIVGSIKFEGNTVYSSEKLLDLVFTKPGMIFNRTFFRNDIQRIKEKYQKDGYVMANIADVKISGNEITVIIVEPKIEQIIIQGNKITKQYVVRRYMKIKEGELFNSNKLRLTLNRLQAVGFFSDVNVNFEPGEKADEVILILTVEEGKTGRLGFNVAYGTESGFGGGMSYENTNIGGKGYKLGTGFELGNRSEYWITYEQPYMSGKVTAWRVGAYKRAWNNLGYYIKGNTYPDGFKYDRDKKGAYYGFGRKFSDTSKYNWYFTLDWHTVENVPTDGLIFDDVKDRINDKGRRVIDDLGEGDYYSGLLSFRRLNIDEYLPYSKGDVQILNLQYGRATVNKKDFNYFKYWLETKYYLPVGHLFKNFFESSIFTNTQDRPPMFAARLMLGSASGDVPYEEMYAIGGDTTLRGYKDEEFRGEDMLLANLELRIPIEKAFGFVVFYDIGRSWRRDTNISLGSDIGSAPGFGVRLNTPLGNMRLDYASGSEDRFHFGFGELF
ncbi:MAG: BamA/OMP85 family outer membrane protein [Synergistaceae bacterium]